MFMIKLWNVAKLWVFRINLYLKFLVTMLTALKKNIAVFTVGFIVD